ncbi:MAG: GIY-YIG nuclease family protein, partial [Sphingobium sp.]|nr:GIY-YIG nuclease family protein [Sphingobium sp.]
RPVTLVWSETFGTRIEALEAERIVGGWSRAKKEALIAGNWSLLSYFARPPKERNVGYASCTPNDVERPQAQSERVSTSLDTNGCGAPSREERY